MRMCNQFRLPNLKQIQQYLKSDLDLPLVTPSFDIQAQDVFPNHVSPVLLYQNGQLQVSNKTWRYPSPVDPKKPLFNARIERFYDSAPSMWDKSFAKQRCLILTEKFFEYAKTTHIDRKSTRLNSSHVSISYAVFCLKKKKKTKLHFK